MKKSLILTIMFMVVFGFSSASYATWGSNHHNDNSTNTTSRANSGSEANADADALGVGVGVGISGSNAEANNRNTNLGVNRNTVVDVDRTENTNRNRTDVETDVEVDTEAEGGDAFQLQGQVGINKQGQIGVNTQDQTSVGRVRTDVDTPVTTNVSTPVDTNVTVGGDSYNHEDNSVYMPVSTSPGKTEVGLTVPGIGGIVLSDDSGPENDILAYLDMVGRMYQAKLISPETAQKAVAEALPVLWKQAKKGDGRHIGNLGGILPFNLLGFLE